jgi:Spy/CpxP family protein refolding chaperone
MKTRKKTRREAAIIRQEAYAKLTPQQKIEKLNTKLGINVGATKERNKLQEILTKTKQ